MKKRHIAWSAALVLTAIHATHAGFSDKLKKTIGSAVCFACAHQQASPETQKLTHQTAQQIHPGFQPVTVKRLNALGKMVYGYQNAMAIPFLDHVVVNEEWLKKLSPEGRKFVIGRTLMPLEHAYEYTTYKYLFPFLVSTLAKHINYGHQPRPANDIVHQFLNPTQITDITRIANEQLHPDMKHLVDLLGYLLSQYISRSWEYEADEAAATKLNCVQGGIEVLNDMKTIRSEKSLLGRLSASVPLPELLNLTARHHPIKESVTI